VELDVAPVVSQNGAVGEKKVKTALLGRVLLCEMVNDLIDFDVTVRVADTP
jgi:hypothetical protein